MAKLRLLSDADRRAALRRHITGLRLFADAETRLGAQAGVNMRVWRRAAGGRPVAADAHMAICAVLFLDPVTILPPQPVAPLAGPVCWATLGAGVRVTRELRGHSGRAAAKVAGVSVATVSRCENGHALSFDALARLAAYVGLHPHACTAPAMPGAACSTGNTHCNSLKSQEAGHAD